MGYAYICHAPEDADYAHRLARHLESHGIETWDDHSDTAPGTRFRQAVRGAIDTCDVFVLVMTPDAEYSVWVGDEVEWAERQTKPIVPLLIEGEPWFGFGSNRCEVVGRDDLPAADLIGSKMSSDSTPSTRPRTPEPKAPSTTGRKGRVTVLSAASHDVQMFALQGAVDSLPSDTIDVAISTIEHHPHHERMSDHLRAGKHDVVGWYGGYQNKTFAEHGLIGDISDVWANVDGLGPGFKAASTAPDGKQYFMPTTCYTWAVNYSKNVFSEMGYEEPQNLAELTRLATRMQADGITPFASANEGKWPAMGMFDILNMRVNGYEYHIDLLGGRQRWGDPRTQAVFELWETLLPFHQANANHRSWQEAAEALQDGQTGMLMLGSFAASFSDQLAEDMDFFNFPEVDPTVGAGALDAPCDGFQMIANPSDEAAAKEFLLHMSTPAAQNPYLGDDRITVGSNSAATAPLRTSLQRKSAALASSATGLAQFADRDTIPGFASDVLGPMLAGFIDKPSTIAEALDDAQQQWDSISTQWLDESPVGR